MKISEVNIKPIKPQDGLVAFASCVLDKKLYVGSLGVHQKLDGLGYRITYPTKKIGNRQINYFHPVTKHLGKAIETAICKKCVELFEKSDETDDRHSKIVNSNP